MPGAVFTLNNSVTKSIYRRISDNLIKVPDFENFEKVHSDILQDKFAAAAFKFISEMDVPLEPEMNLFAASVAEIPDEIYSVSSLKAIIDLEFDLCAANNIHFKKCETCGRFFIIDGDGFGMRYCDRVTGNGKTCIENFDDLRLSIAAARRGNADSAEQVHPTHADEKDYLVNKEEFFPGIGERVQIKYSKPVREFTPAEVPDELERRGQKLYNSLYKRVGKAMSEQEFREWSQYLSNMKRNIKTGEGSAEQLSQFLDYSEKLADEIKRAVKDKKPMRREPVERLTRFAATTDNMHSIGTRRFPEYIADENVRENAGEFIQDNADFYDDEDDNFTPFKPEIIPSVKAIFKDGSPFDEPGEPETVEIDGRQVTLTKPKWERVYRDDID
jgi:hypothetical protein